MSTYDHVISIQRMQTKIETGFKKPLFGCDLCRRNILFRTRRQLLIHLTRTHNSEISKDEYLRIRKIVRTIEQGHQEGVLIL